MRRENNARPGDRRGAGLVAALVCLVLVIALIGSMVRIAGARRKRILNEERRLQAAWLAESGLDRAWARWRADPAYRGEVWVVPAEELGSVDPGRVSIAVEPSGDRAGRARVRVEADYPADEDRRARQSRTVDFESGGDAPGDRR